MIYKKSNALNSLKPNTQWTWIGDEYSGLTWSDSGSAPTESDINAELTKLTNAEPMRLLRVERDAKLHACDWKASSDVTLSDAWKTYRQALRDLPANTADPFNVTWPANPDDPDGSKT